MRWEDRLTPAVLAALTPAQHKVLRIGRPYELDPVFAAERDREDGVRWGTPAELDSLLLATTAVAVARI